MKVGPKSSLASRVKRDVFISHASEDKNLIARPLARALEGLGLKVWFDEKEIRLGDSLSRAIDNGLAECEFGVLIVSSDFLNKKWPEYEYRGLVAKEMAFGKSILPVWHEVTLEQVVSFSPTLADKFAVSSDNKTIDEIALDVLKAAKPDLFEGVMRRIELRRRMRVSAVEVMELSTLQQAPVIHGTLPPRLLIQMKLVWLVISEAYPCSFDEWIDGFTRDAHPSDELLIWQKIAAAFFETKYRMKVWDKDIANEVLSTLLFSCAADESDLDKINTKRLSKKKKLEVYRRFHSFVPSDVETRIKEQRRVKKDGLRHRQRLASVEDLSVHISDEIVDKLSR